MYCKQGKWNNKKGESALFQIIIHSIQDKKLSVEEFN